MKILLLCGYFEAIHQNEIAKKTKTWVENAANTFQKRLIDGFAQHQYDLTIVSAPFIGAFPNVYRDIRFNGFKKESNEVPKIQYVKFNNIWGYRNISRASSLKKTVKEYVSQNPGERIAIVVYSPHTPFLEAALYAKKLNSKIHIHMIVPDLPQYMNLSKKAHPIYDFFKKYDLKRFYHLNERIDSYTLLTQPMADVLNVGKRPYIVVEAISNTIYDGIIQSRHIERTTKIILYAGKLNESFGIMRLLDAFDLIKEMDIELHICGGGECRENVELAAKANPKIHYHGLLTAEETANIMKDVDVLVNPRINDDQYTKYSFPSKNLEYLSTGNAVVAYMLDGMPPIYADFIVEPQDTTPSSLADAIVFACQNGKSENRQKSCMLFFEYMKEHLSAENVANRILRMIE